MSQQEAPRKPVGERILERLWIWYLMLERAVRAGLERVLWPLAGFGGAQAFLSPQDVLKLREISLAAVVATFAISAGVSLAKDLGTLRETEQKSPFPPEA